MGFLLQPVLSYLLLYKYYALFAVIFAGALAIPIPSTLTLMAAADFSAAGYLNIWWVISIAILANIIGDNLTYFVAKRYGKSFFRGIGLRKMVDSQTFSWIEDEVCRYQAFVIVISRFFGQTSLPVNIITGMSKTHYPTYLLYVTVGESLTVLLFAGVGYFLGNSWQYFDQLFGQFTIVVLLIIALGLALASKKVHHRVMRRREEFIQRSDS